MRRWNAFFVVIPVRGNKYYIPPNGIDLYEPWKFWGVRITKNFWCVCDDKKHFSCVFLFPKKQRFLTSFFMQIHSGNPNFFQFTFALTCVPKMVCAWLHTKSEMLRSKIWDGFEKIPYRTKFMLLPWPETPPLPRPCGHEELHEQGRGGDWLAISSVPDAFVKKSF